MIASDEIFRYIILMYGILYTLLVCGKTINHEPSINQKRMNTLPNLNKNTRQKYILGETKLKICSSQNIYHHFKVIFNLYIYMCTYV